MKIDFRIVHINKVVILHPRPEYILVNGLMDERIANKYFPDYTTIQLAYGNTDSIYQTFMEHLTDLQEVYESLIDEESKKTFCGYWLGRISNKMSEFVYMNNAHYLIAGFIPERNAIVIDGGAYDGVTGAIFKEMGYNVYGFEMDKVNFNYAKKIADEKNFVVENLSLGAYKHTMHYNLEGSSSKWNDSGSEITQVTTIDAYARENNLPSVDFIKLDVEGSELEILKGAKTSIARYKPILAISAYHKLDDFWTLMNFIKSIRPDYEFALRHGYETPEEEPLNFPNKYELKLLNLLGLEQDRRYWGECVLFAR